MKVTFRDWVKAARVTDDPAGDFIEDARSDKRMPEDFLSLRRLRLYLSIRNACPEAIAAARDAWRRYKGWKKRCAAKCSYRGIPE
jgi:hypothetical protein